MGLIGDDGSFASISPSMISCEDFVCILSSIREKRRCDGVSDSLDPRIKSTDRAPWSNIQYNANLPRVETMGRSANHKAVLNTCFGGLLTKADSKEDSSNGRFNFGTSSEDLNCKILARN